MPQTPFIVITPARNEEQFISRTIESVVSQSVFPIVWVIVDDGSTDNTASLAERAARTYPWIKVAKRENRGYRSLGGGVVDAFYYGLNTVGAEEYDFLFKIDADIVLGPNFFAAMLAKFERNPRLGIAAGEVYDVVKAKMEKNRVLPVGFTGAVKCWRKTCFDDIGGLARGLGWDAIDCYQAMRRGWETLTFADPDLTVTHLRLEGTSLKNRYLYWLSRGKGLYFVGAHPVWIGMSALYHMLDRPVILGGMCMIIGYLTSLLDKPPRYEDMEFRKYLRTWQLKRLATLLRLA
jgi:glycosyltransferase involved in cell wall biosynthesis